MLLEQYKCECEYLGDDFISDDCSQRDLGNCLDMNYCSIKEGCDVNHEFVNTCHEMNEIECIEHLQRANTTMIEIGLEYKDRKNKLYKLYMKHHAEKLMKEIEVLEG